MGVVLVTSKIPRQLNFLNQILLVASEKNFHKGVFGQFGTAVEVGVPCGLRCHTGDIL